MFLESKAGSSSLTRQGGLGLLILAVGLFVAGSAIAQSSTRSMVGAVSVINPSVSPPNFFEVGPEIFGRKVGTYPPDRGAGTLQVAGTAAGTSTARQVTIPAGNLNFTGFQRRDFPTFPSVGNGLKTYMSAHLAATFQPGGGAVAACPGPGCTSGGAGTAISWCPPAAEATANPAPGTAGNRVGDWTCTGWLDGVLGGNQFLQISISNSPSRPKFGGTFSLLRNTIQDNWAIDVQPTQVPGTGEAFRNFRTISNLPWPGGQENFAYNSDVGFLGPKLNVTIGTGGGLIYATDGCVNAGGDPGGAFNLSGPAIGGVGVNCGTPTAMSGVQNPLAEWGFRLTTGTISGSDPFPGAPFPFGKIVTTRATASAINGPGGDGTPFAPNVSNRDAALGFFFSRAGANSVVGSQRNLVMLGGGVATDPISGNTFYRLTELRFQLNPAPEPVGLAGLFLAVGGIGAVARRRQLKG